MRVFTCDLLAKFRVFSHDLLLKFVFFLGGWGELRSMFKLPSSLFPSLSAILCEICTIFFLLSIVDVFFLTICIEICNIFPWKTDKIHCLFSQSFDEICNIFPRSFIETCDFSSSFSPIQEILEIALIFLRKRIHEVTICRNTIG